MRTHLRLEEGIAPSPWKTRQIKDRIEIQHRKEFEKIQREAEAERVSKVSLSVPDENQSTEENDTGSEDQENPQS